MTTAWTLTATEICSDAMKHLGYLDISETASGNEMQTALRGLDIVLKELPLVGYHWPKLSAETALTWAGIQAMVLPTDYYGFPVAWGTQNAVKYRLTQISHAEWVQMPNRTAAGTPSHFYISPAGVFNVWPTPTTDPGVYLQYQKIVDDASLSVTPDVLQIWKGALGYGVADQIGLQLGAPQEKRVEIAKRWTAKRERALQSSIPNEEITFGVSE